MSENDVPEDFELDPETLRKIEDDAQRAVEAELAADVDKLKDLEEDRDDWEAQSDVDEDTLRQIERDALESVGLDPDQVSLLDTDETEAPALAAEPPVEIESAVASTPAEEPIDSEPVAGRMVPIPEPAAPKVVKAKNVSKGKSRPVPAVSQSYRGPAPPATAVPIPKAGMSGNKIMVLVVVGCLIILLAIMLVIAAMRNSSDDPAANATPSAAKQFSDFNSLKYHVKGMIKLDMSPDNLRAAIGKIEEWKAANPNDAVACDQEIAKLNKHLAFVTQEAPAPALTP